MGGDLSRMTPVITDVQGRGLSQTLLTQQGVNSIC